MLPPRFEEPAGFTWGSFKDAGGANIRYGSLQPKGEPKGTIVLVSGLRELTEKYFEVIRDMTDRGYAVWMMDWHGQGGSDRLVPAHPQRLHSTGYAEHIATLNQFAQTIVKKSGGPLILMGHSMGAHIGLRHLKEHPGVFDSAVFTSPMCDIVMPRIFPRPVAKGVVSWAKATNRLQEYVPGGHDWDASNEEFKDNRLTNDPVRFAVLPEIFRKDPAMKMGDPTYGWIMHTFNSLQALNDPPYLKAINTPILMGISGDDKVVHAQVSKAAAALMPNCKTIDFPQARHELWMEQDAMRKPWLDQVEAFLQETVSQYALSKKKPNVKQPPRPPGP